MFLNRICRAHQLEQQNCAQQVVISHSCTDNILSDSGLFRLICFLINPFLRLTICEHA